MGGFFEIRGFFEMVGWFFIFCMDGMTYDGPAGFSPRARLSKGEDKYSSL